MSHLFDHDDPFGEDTQTVRPAEERGELQPHKISAGAKQKRVNYEEKTRKLWRDERGYCYYPFQHFVSAGHFYGGNAAGQFRDGFGCIDAVAIGHGEVVFLQTSSLKQKSAKKDKVLRGTYKIGGTKEYPIVEVIARIAGIPNVRYVLCLWEQEGRFWKPTEIDVTADLLATWGSKRERRTA